MTVEDVLITADLRRRTTRRPDFQRETEALHELAAGLHGATRNFFGCVVKSALNLCRADSSGLSVLSEEGDVFRWEALAGDYKDFVGGTTPRSFSPCGTCLDRGEAVLYDRPHRFFDFLAEVRPQVIEGLVVPVFCRKKARATLWIVSHDTEHRFDREDVRIMTSLATFIGMVLGQKEIEQRLRVQTHELENSNRLNHAILSTSPDSVKVLDANGRLIFINEPGLRLLEVKTPETVLRKKWAGFWTGAEKRKATAALGLAVKSGAAKFEGCRATLKGISKWWNVTINRLPGVEGRVLVVSRDITELKRTERLLREAKDEVEKLAKGLAKKVAERTREVNAVNRRLLLLARKLVESQETERTFIAKELHDEMGQHLTGLKLLLERVGYEEGLGFSAEIARAKEIVRMIMGQVRDLSFDLRQSLPDHVSLVAALKWHFEKLEVEHGFKVRFTCNARENEPVPPEHSRTLLRLIQEALTNVLRHAEVKKASVQLRIGRSSVSVSVVDRGRGFEITRGGQPRRLGLAGMRERVLLLGGKLSVKSAPGAGTRIKVFLPKTEQIL